ncbi:hypothetical protein GW781_11315 [bacterium]|nr:hypothetical protein [bacterium]NCT21732.1 hypothetical protein [bacterium]
MTVFSLAVKRKAGVFIQERLFSGVILHQPGPLIAHFRRLLLDVFQLLGILTQFFSNLAASL